MTKHLLFYNDKGVFNEEQSDSSTQDFSYSGTGNYGRYYDQESGEWYEDVTTYEIMFDYKSQLPYAGQPLEITYYEDGEESYTDSLPFDGSIFEGEAPVDGAWYFMCSFPGGQYYCFNATVVSTGTTATTIEGETVTVQYAEYRCTLPGEESQGTYYGLIGIEMSTQERRINGCGVYDMAFLYESLNDLVLQSEPVIEGFAAIHLINKQCAGDAEYVTSVLPGVAYVDDQTEGFQKVFYNKIPFTVTVKCYNIENVSGEIYDKLVLAATKAFNDMEISMDALRVGWEMHNYYDIVMTDDDDFYDGQIIYDRDTMFDGLNNGEYRVDFRGTEIRQGTLRGYNLTDETFTRKANKKTVSLISFEMVS